MLRTLIAPALIKRYKVDTLIFNLSPTAWSAAYGDCPFLINGDNSSSIYFNFRTIRAYEQGYRDINKASYENLSNLADALECDIEELLEK